MNDRPRLAIAYLLRLRAGRRRARLQRTPRRSVTPTPGLRSCEAHLELSKVRAGPKGEKFLTTLHRQTRTISRPVKSPPKQGAARLLSGRGFRLPLACS
jgi:hypothetical protein